MEIIVINAKKVILQRHYISYSQIFSGITKIENIANNIIIYLNKYSKSIILQNSRYVQTH